MTLTNLPPITLDADQQAAVFQSIAEPTRSVLNSSGLGTGKTVVTVETIMALGLRRVLVVAPKGTATGWRVTFERQGSTLPFYRLDNSKAGKANQEAYKDGAEGVFFVGHEMFVRLGQEKRIVQKRSGTTETKTEWSEFLHTEVDAVVYDEIHKVKNPQSRSFKCLFQTREYATWKFGLSGTWFGNKFDGAYTVTKWLWDDLIPDRYADWLEAWCSTEFSPFGYLKKKVLGEKNPGEYVKWLPCVVNIQRPLDVDHAQEDVFVELSSAQRKMYTMLEEEYIAWLVDESLRGEVSPLVIEAPIALRARLRQATLGDLYLDEEGAVAYPEGVKSPKLDALEDVLEGKFEGESALILTDSEKFHKRIVERLGDEARSWPRASQAKAQEQFKVDFANGEFKFAVAVVSRLGAGVDMLQHGTRNMVWLSVSDNGVDNEQVQGRIARRGVIGDVREVHIRALDTVDVDQWANLASQAAARVASLGNAPDASDNIHFWRSLGNSLA